MNALSELCKQHPGFWPSRLTPTVAQDYALLSLELGPFLRRISERRTFSTPWYGRQFANRLPMTSIAFRKDSSCTHASHRSRQTCSEDFWSSRCAGRACVAFRHARKWRPLARPLSRRIPGTKSFSRTSGPCESGRPRSSHRFLSSEYFGVRA